MLVHGGHGFKNLKDTEMIEIKQGPYNLIKDKIKFENSIACPNFPVPVLP